MNPDISIDLDELQAAAIRRTLPVTRWLDINRDEVLAVAAEKRASLTEELLGLQEVCQHDWKEVEKPYYSPAEWSPCHWWHWLFDRCCGKPEVEVNKWQKQRCQKCGLEKDNFLDGPFLLCRVCGFASIVHFDWGG